MASKNTIFTGLLLLMILSSCAGPNTAVVETASAPGFLWGLLHGWIIAFAFIVSIFDSSVGVYEVANSGGWYDFGFVLGIGAFSGGCSKACES